jgi:hypothetical protein
MGTLLAIFTRDRTKAQDFLDKLRSYFRANKGVAGFDSFIHKVSIALTLIKGPAVAGWTHSMGDWINGLDPLQDDYKIVWTQFQQEFHDQFTDSQQQQHAHIELNSLKMRFPNVDQYIARFTDLVQLAGYTIGNKETINLFLHGLTPSILNNMIQPPFINDYVGIKEQAIQLTKARQMTKAIKARRGIGNQGPFQRPQILQNFFGNNQQCPQYILNTKTKGTISIRGHVTNKHLSIICQMPQDSTITHQYQWTPLQDSEHPTINGSTPVQSLRIMGKQW